MGTLTIQMLRKHIVGAAAAGMWLATTGIAGAAETNAATPVAATETNTAVNLATNLTANLTNRLATNTAASIATNGSTNLAAKPVVVATPKPAAPAPAAPVAPVGKTDYVAFKIINDRNIFNPNRTSRSAAPVVTTERPKVVKVESFALLGTMSYAKGSVAFFDGSNSSYKKAAKPADTIANYKIKEIAPNGVKLESGGKEVELRVGMQMRRQDEGEWQIGSKTESYATTSRSSSNDSPKSATSTSREDGASTPPPATTGTDSGAGGGASDLLKRLMEQRAKELAK